MIASTNAIGPAHGAACNVLRLARHPCHAGPEPECQCGKAGEVWSLAPSEIREYEFGPAEAGSPPEYSWEEEDRLSKPILILWFWLGFWREGENRYAKRKIQSSHFMSLQPKQTAKELIDRKAVRPVKLKKAIVKNPACE